MHDNKRWTPTQTAASENSTEIGGKLGIQEGCAERQPQNLNDGYGVQTDPSNQRPLH